MRRFACVWQQDVYKRQECTGTINGEEVTTDGADYVARLTLRSLQYYAAVEKKFDELGGLCLIAAHADHVGQRLYVQVVFQEFGHFHSGNAARGADVYKRQA